MSTRSQVKLISSDFSTPIYLYQHCDGYALYKIVCNAIARQDRWDDPEYLSRIIFSEMLLNGGDNALTSSTGYGISTTQNGDVEYIVEVNMNDQTLTEYEGYGNDWSIKTHCKFADATITRKDDLYKCD